MQDKHVWRSNSKELLQKEGEGVALMNYQRIVHLPVRVFADQEDNSRVDAHKENMPPDLEDNCALETQHHAPLGVDIDRCAVLASHVRCRLYM